MLARVGSFNGIVAAALAANLRVKDNGSGKLVVAVAADGPGVELGTTANRTYNADESVSVIPHHCGGTKYMIASGAISQYAKVFAGAGGKVAATGTVERGIALEAAAADGHVIEVLPHNC